MATPNPVPRLYKSVVEDVIGNVREAFLDEGVDEQVLQELKQLWESKLQQSRAVETVVPEPDPRLPTTIQYAPMIPQHAQQQPQQPTAVFQHRPVVTAAASVPQQTVPVHAQLAQGGDLSGPAAAAAMALPSGLFQQQLAALNAQGLTLQHAGNGQFILQSLPQTQAAGPGHPGATLTFQHQPTLIQQQPSNQAGATQVSMVPQTMNLGIPQLDGTHDTSSSEEEFEDDEKDDENEEEQNEEDNEGQGEEEEPLNSEDDVSDEDPQELFDTDNVVVCQYDKINRNKNKWKFHLKDGIMNLNGRDYVFQKATGEAEW